MDKCYVLPTQVLCNADCVFCATKFYQPNAQNSFMQLDNWFDCALGTVKKSQIQKFEITGGGEPCLNSRLFSIIQRISDEMPQAQIKLYSNGSILRSIPLVEQVNISRVHWNSKTNNKFMRFRSNKVSHIVDALSFFRPFAKQLRLSIPIVKGGIDSAKAVEKLLLLTDSIVDEYILRPLFEITPNKQNYFCDFEFDHPKVVIDRHSCEYDESRHLTIWAPNNQIYDNWALKGNPLLN